MAAALVALVIITLWQHRRVHQLSQETVTLRDQLQRAATLHQQENEQLAQQLRTAAQRSEGESTELARLRGQVGRARRIEQENAQLKIERDQLAKKAFSSTPNAQEPDAQQTPEQKLQRAKGFFGRDIGLALITVAEANGGNVPTELSGPVFDMVEALSGGGEHDFRVKSFELVYKGSLHDVKDRGETILAREKEPTQRADGQWVRVYVMADGSSHYIGAEAPNGFAAKEKELWPGQFKP